MPLAGNKIISGSKKIYNGNITLSVFGCNSVTIDLSI